VQVAFSQRRKILRHTLGKWLEKKFSGTFARSAGRGVPVDEYLRCRAFSRGKPAQTGETCGSIRNRIGPGQAQNTRVLRALAK
jgi:hypothetical protein